ncbi:MAG: FecR domain-containing protein, partial [Polyangiales bacterium]
MFARKRRRTQIKGTMAVLGAVLAVLGFGVAWKRLHVEKPAPQAVAPPAMGPVEGETITFADGSVAAPLDKTSLLKSKEVTASKIDVELVKGSAHFEVSKHPERVFRVEAGAVTVEVLGTGFIVERLGDGARVAVEHGRVKVQWGAGSTILGDGEGSTFPPAAPATSTTIAGPSPSATVAPSAPPSGSKTTWKALAHEGEFDKAYAALKIEGGATAVHDDAGELLLAADVARLSHHPADSVVHLRRVVASHSGDPRAP